MQSQLKVLAPVITRDISLPNFKEKIPMVMVPVPDSKTLMAIPIETLGQMTGTKDEQQAKDLLNWDEGVGTLDGCDLRFKINSLGCLEVLDSSDDESREQSRNRHKEQYLTQQSQQQQLNHQYAVEQNVYTQDKAGSSSSNGNKSSSSSSSNGSRSRQISPGSSLLRDGPDNRRARASSSSTSITPTTQPQSHQLPLSTKKLTETSNQQALLLERLIPKNKLEEYRANVDNWTNEDVKEFVDSIPGCFGNSLFFERHQIDGKSLLYLTQKDLTDIMSLKLGPAIKIYNAIQFMKS